MVRENGSLLIEGVPAEERIQGAFTCDGTMEFLRAVLKFKSVEDVKTVGQVFASDDFRTKAVDGIRRIRAVEEATITEIEKALESEQ